VIYPWKLRIDANVRIGDFVELYTLGDIHIGENAVVSQKSYLLHIIDESFASQPFAISAPQPWPLASSSTTDRSGPPMEQLSRRTPRTPLRPARACRPCDAP